MLRIFKHWATPWILALIAGGISLIPDNTSWIPSIILWVIAGIWFLIIIIYNLKNKPEKQKETDNWIITYEKRTNRLPPIPDYLLPVVIGYETGNPLSKEIQLIPMSGQYWNRLLPSQRNELKQLAEWLGMDWDDYYELMRRMLPKDLKLKSKHKPFSQD